MMAPGSGKLALTLAALNLLCGIPYAQIFAYGIDDLPETQAAVSLQSSLHLKCLQVEKRAEDDIGAMIPHRAWTWRLNFEKSRRQLDQLRRDLVKLHDAEAQFEASLDSKQKSKVGPQLESLEALWQHLDSDARSLDSELQTAYPTRWHVARDALDMRKEIRRWNKLHGQVVAMLRL
jgi:hypothetical protein